MREKRTVATVLAVLSGAILASISTALLAPIKWNLHYPGGRAAVLSGLAFSVLVSVAAAKTWTKWFYVLLVWVIMIVVYLAFFYRPPMWT